MRNLDSCRCWRRTWCPCKVRNKFLVNFWNRTILLCIPCIIGIIVNGGRRWRSCLRNCATSRKVAGPVPDGVTGIFHWLNPSSRTMALGSIQKWVPGVSTVCVGVGWSRLSRNPGILNFLQPWGPVQACKGIDSTFYHHSNSHQPCRCLRSGDNDNDGQSTRVNHGESILFGLLVGETTCSYETPVLVAPHFRNLTQRIGNKTFKNRQFFTHTRTRIL